MIDKKQQAKILFFVRRTVIEAIKQLKAEDFSSQQQNFIKRISLDLDSNHTTKKLKVLQKGFIVKKHSPNTKEYHNKFVYVTTDHRFLCWKSLNKNDEKYIQLSKITQVIHDNVGKYAVSKTIKNTEEVVIIMAERRLQLQMRNNMDKSELVQGLFVAIKNSKRLHLSYKF